MRVLSIASTGAIFLLLNPISVHGMSTMSLQAFQQIWSSELDTQSYEDALTTYEVEFNTHLDAITTANLSDRSSELFPYIVCHSGLNLSGFDRRAHVASVLDISHDDSLSNIVYNTDEKTCFLASVPHLTARRLSGGNNSTTVQDEDGHDVIFRPVTSFMKMRMGLMERIEEIRVGSATQNSVAVQFCPGSVMDDNSAQQLGENLMNQAVDFMNRRSRRELSEVDSSFTMERFIWADDFESMNSRRQLSRISGSYHSKGYSGIPTHAARWREAMASENMSICAETLRSSTLVYSDKHSMKIDFLDSNMDVSGSILSDCMLTLTATLSTFSQVCGLEKELAFKVHNDIAQWIVQSNAVNRRPFYDIANLRGKGQIVAVSDSGLDTNNCYFWDSTPGELRDGTIQMNRRKVVQYNNYKDDSDTLDGHGTHVVGTIVGKRSINGTLTGEVTGIAEGIASEAKVSFFDLGLGEACCFVPGFRALFDPGYNIGARIHSGSWGSLDSSYSTTSWKFDKYTNDYDDFLIILAAGNDGASGLPSTLGTPGTAKNCLTVGASHTAGRDLYYAMEGPDYLAYFSSRGPTTDGRMKPEIVAPGYNILSAGARPSSVGECDPPSITALGEAGADTSSFGLTYKAGTSMATPVVSGIATLLRQYLMEGFYPSGSKVSTNSIPNPSSALIKALLLNGAQSLKGITDDFTPISDYDNNQGFGRVNLGNSVPLKGYNDFRLILNDRILIENNQKHAMNVTISNICDLNELSITLAWIDVVGVPGCTDCLVNDLDLTVKSIQTGMITHSNGGSMKDSKNNVERVRVAAMVGDIYEITVTAANLATQNQTYAIAMTGCFVDDSSEMREISTDFDSDNGESGIMFDIITNTNDIEVDEIDIQTSSNITLNADYGIRVYHKYGSYRNFTASSTAWSIVAETTVPGAGVFKTVKLPEALKLSHSSIHGIYITITTGNGVLLYGNSTSSAEEKSYNDDMIIAHGSGIVYPFLYEFPNRSWKGDIRYTSCAATKEISTAFAGLNGESGNMFNVKAHTNDVEIREMAIHTDATSVVRCLIYTKSGSFTDSMTSAHNWTLVSDVEVEGQGFGNVTKLPTTSFHPVRMNAHTTQAFYVTLQSGTLMYHTGSSVGGSAANNTDLMIQEGVGVVSNFGMSFSPRVWNGVLKYSVIKTVLYNEAVTRFSGTNSVQGVMYDVIANKTITIHEIDIHTAAVGEQTVEIYTRAGSYQGMALSSVAWSKVGPSESITVQGKGPGLRTTIKSGSFDPVRVEAGSSQGFYITLTHLTQRYTSSAMTTGEAYSSSDLKILVGSAITYPFKNNIGSAMWDGALRYTKE